MPPSPPQKNNPLLQRDHNACPLKLRITNSQNITNNFDNNPHNFIIN